MIVDYPFVDGDPLEDRFDYAYSEYHGPGFIDGWRVAREGARSEGAIVEEQGVVADVGGGEETLATLTDIGRRLRSGDQTLLARLDDLVQRFEVTKRVRGAYGNGSAAHRSF